MGRPRSINFNDFLLRARQIHGNKYEYDEDTYEGVTKKMRMICKIHGEFYQEPGKHYFKKGVGCSKCAGNKRYTRKEIIEKIENRYPNKFLYTKFVKYENNFTKFILICKQHGEIETTWADIMNPRNKYGCKYCAIKIQSEIRRGTTENFILKARKIHGNKYDYSRSIYIGYKKEIKIICKKHGEFITKARVHLRGLGGCRECAKKANGDKKRKTTPEFIESASKVHGNEYDYSLVDYKGVDKKVKLICKKCNNIFITRAATHLQGSGCPKCNISKGEKSIENFLKENNIRYETQKTFKKLNLLSKGCLKFDFYLPDSNLCIEYQGKQHFKSVEYWDGIDGLIKRVGRDQIKWKFCKDNDIDFMEIPYWEYNIIENILRGKSWQ